MDQAVGWFPGWGRLWGRGCVPSRPGPGISDSLQIRANADGPLKISNVRSLSFCGKAVDVQGDVYLCRCGESRNAPFGDGTHKAVGFTGENPPREAKAARTWEGAQIRTIFDPNICMHVFLCKPLKALRERESAGDVAAAHEITRVVESCPSGALRWEAQGALRPEIPDPDGAQVVVIEGGEVRVRGDFLCEGFELPAGMAGDRATLCRCGLSRFKPWCDGRPKGKKGFR